MMVAQNDSSRNDIPIEWFELLKLPNNHFTTFSLLRKTILKQKSETGT